MPEDKPKEQKGGEVVIPPPEEKFARQFDGFGDLLTDLGADAIGAFEREAPKVLEGVVGLFEGLAALGGVRDAAAVAEEATGAVVDALPAPPKPEVCPRCELRQALDRNCWLCRGTGMVKPSGGG